MPRETPGRIMEPGAARSKEGAKTHDSKRKSCSEPTKSSASTNTEVLSGVREMDERDAERDST